MAIEISNEPNRCIFQWKIKNISHCWLKTDELFESPPFFADALEGTEWTLRLSLRPTQANVGFYISRRKDCNGPNTIEVNFRMAFLDQNSLPLKEQPIKKRVFQKGVGWGYSEFENFSKIFITHRNKYLADDTLIVRCAVWKSNAEVEHINFLHAHTVFKVNRTSFTWIILDFSTLVPGGRNHFKDDLVEFDLVINETMDLERKLDIQIISVNESTQYFWFKTALVCGESYEVEFELRDLKPGTVSTLFYDQKLFNHKNRYLPDDRLILDCEFISSNGTYLHEVCSCGIILPELKKPMDRIDMVEELNTMYRDMIFCDIEIRTETKTFKAHRNILSARSPTFKRMLYLIKESRHIDISLEDDTLHRMLLYIYTDTLEHLQFQEAFKLYAAADKFEIKSLKDRCLSFLIQDLSPRKAYDVLVMANSIQDNDLKKAVQDYVFWHDREVYGWI